MAGISPPLPFTVGASGSTTGLTPPFFFRLGVPASTQAGLYLPFGFNFGAGLGEEKPDGAGGHKHVLVFPRYEEERRQVVESLRETQTIAIDGNEITVDLPVVPDAPIDEQPIPLEFEADRELIDLVRLDEQLRYQQLLEAIRMDEDRLMEELAIFLMLDA